MSNDVLGSRWEETEVGGWQGVWNRIPNKSPPEFSAEFTHPRTGQRIGGQLRMEVEGNTVHIHRWNPNGAPGSCKYTGTLSGNRVAGTYYCTDQNGQPTPTYHWSAVIT
jgi:hypothetical protein